MRRGDHAGGREAARAAHAVQGAGGTVQRSLAGLQVPVAAVLPGGAWTGTWLLLGKGTVSGYFARGPLTRTDSPHPRCKNTGAIVLHAMQFHVGVGMTDMVGAPGVGLTVRGPCPRRCARTRWTRWSAQWAPTVTTAPPTARCGRAVAAVWEDPVGADQPRDHARLPVGGGGQGRCRRGVGRCRRGAGRVGRSFGWGRRWGKLHAVRVQDVGVNANSFVEGANDSVLLKVRRPLLTGRLWGGVMRAVVGGRCNCDVLGTQLA